LLSAFVAAVVELDHRLHLECCVANNEVGDLAIECVSRGAGAGGEQRTKCDLGKNVEIG
jgi:hypothetical protein